MPSIDPHHSKAVAPPDHVVLSARGISKRFGATVVLCGTSFDLRAARVHILLGENGAGKSTLGKIIAGLLPPDDGEIVVGGVAHRGYSIKTARAAGVEMVLQELSLVPQLSVRTNLFLGHENRLSSLMPIDRRAEAKEAPALLRRFGLTCDPIVPVASLPMAERQLIEIAKAARGKPKIIVMDEPSSRLTQREKAALFATVRALRDAGTAVLYVTHHLNEVAEIGDRVSAMRDGQIVETTDVSPSLDEKELLRMLTGREIVAMRRRAATRAEKPLLDIRSLSVGDLCRDVDLQVGRGEIVGLYGVVGCGRADIARALVGLRRIRSGEVLLAGQSFRPPSPAAAARAGVTYLPPDRKENGAFAPLDLVANLTLNNLVRYSRFGVIDRAAERRVAEMTLRRLTVRFQSARQPIERLSGGNQQKVLFGRSIDRSPLLVVMEDPTAGIDAGAKQELYRLFEELTSQGISALLLSSDLEETIAVCHRVYTIFNGRIVASYASPSPEDRHAILSDVLGRAAPNESRIAHG